MADDEIGAQKTSGEIEFRVEVGVEQQNGYEEYRHRGHRTISGFFFTVKG
ncbi:hypothetical protein [Paraburkholderia caledonica]